MLEQTVKEAESKSFECVECGGVDSRVFEEYNNGECVFCGTKRKLHYCPICYEEEVFETNNYQMVSKECGNCGSEALFCKGVPLGKKFIMSLVVHTYSFDLSDEEDNEDYKKLVEVAEGFEYSKTVVTREGKNVDLILSSLGVKDSLDVYALYPKLGIHITNLGEIHNWMEFESKGTLKEGYILTKI